MSKLAAFLFMVGSMLLAGEAFAGGGADPAAPCAFYDELSDAMACAPEGYLHSFGARYCREYAQAEPEFGACGQEFLRKNRVCLIEALRARAADLTCSNVEEIAIDSHLGCDLTNDVCALPFPDLWRIFWIARAELRRPAYRDLAWRVRFACLQASTSLKTN